MNKIGVGCASITELEKKYVMDALDNQRLSQGKYVYTFEKKFAQRHNNKFGVMCNSGTSALHIALETLKEVGKWKNSDEVLVPAITFIATSNACLHAGLTPVFVDVDKYSYNINTYEIERKITQNTRAIIPVHTFGMPCDMDKIVSIAQKYNLKIIEDCAEAHFAKYKSQPVGSFGDIAAFSTYVAHTITTGVGGIAITNNNEYMEIMRSLIAHGRSCTCEECIASNPNTVCKKRRIAKTDRRFTFERLGYSYRVGEIEGAIGVAQLERADDIMEKRKQNADKITKGLEEFEELLQLPRHESYVEHTYMMYPIVIKENSKITRDSLIDFLEKNNIETRPMLPLLNQPVYLSLFGNIEREYPVAEYINENGFYIGCHHEISNKDIEYIIKIFKEYFYSQGVSTN